MTKDAETIAEVIVNLRRVFQAVTEYSKNAEKASCLTGPQLWAVKLLEASSPLRVSELARQMYLHPATVIGILDRLDAKGLITRSRSTSDRRVVEIALSGHGRNVVARAPEVAQFRLVKGLAELPEDHFLKVAEGVEQIVRILGAEDMAPHPLLSPEDGRNYFS